LLYRLLPLLLVSFASPAAWADTDNISNDLHEQGRAIYNYRCYFCHGYSGDAKTLTSTYLSPAPRDFTHTDPGSLPARSMIETVKKGKPGTAMHGFSRLLDDQEITAVVEFVRREFMLEKNPNTRYHTVENGWPDHDRYRAAFPFATGSIPLDAPWQQLDPAQMRGKQLFLTSCITCHDRANVEQEGEIWQKQSISYPRNNYSHTIIDAVSSASIYARHDIAPTVDQLTTAAVKGRVLWQQNCAFCHAADGTGENWIGSFLVPKPRDLTDADFMAGMTRESLAIRISEGLINTSMPAWKGVLSKSQINQIISYIDEAFYPLK
jgi:cytochrome c oxidase cbb3-type subunit 3